MTSAVWMIFKWFRDKHKNHLPPENEKKIWIIFIFSWKLVKYISSGNLNWILDLHYPYVVFFSLLASFIIIAFLHSILRWVILVPRIFLRFRRSPLLSPQHYKKCNPIYIILMVAAFPSKHILFSRLALITLQVLDAIWYFVATLKLMCLLLTLIVQCCEYLLFVCAQMCLTHKTVCSASAHFSGITR